MHPIRNGFATEKQRIVIVLGPPGSGKGTQCKRLAQFLRVPHLSTGDLLRQHVESRTNVGRKVEELLKRGVLVPDEIVMKVLRDRVTQADCLGGMVLDGFPRTERQAHLLDDCLHATRGGTSMHVFRLIVPEAVIIRRIAGRRTCPTCGCIFSDCSDRIENDLKCDRDGSPLLVREDDKEETVRYRLQIFEQEISALVGHFAKKEKVIEIEADRAVEQVTQAIFARFCPTA